MTASKSATEIGHSWRELPFSGIDAAGVEHYAPRSSRDPRRRYDTTYDVVTGNTTCNCPARVVCWHRQHVAFASLVTRAKALVAGYDDERLARCARATLAALAGGNGCESRLVAGLEAIRAIQEARRVMTEEAERINDELFG